MKGKLSIGVGRSLDDRGLTSDETAFLLDREIEVAEQELLRALPWCAQLDPVRYRVMVEPSSTMGIGNRTHGLLSLVHTLEAVRQGRYHDAAVGLLASRWAEQVRRRAITLATMMRDGMDPRA